MKEYAVKEHPEFPYEEPKPQELIRCKKCGRKLPVVADGREMLLCMWLRRFVKDDQYCCWGEKEEKGI